MEEMSDISNDIKNIIRGGSDIRALNTVLYFINNKVGINFRLIELHVNKKSNIRQDFNNVFSFAEDNTQSEDIEKSNTNESEVTIEEEEEVDSEAFGDEESESDDEVTASA